MDSQYRSSGPEYDLRAHQELARAFPALAARLRPLLLTEIEIECPHGHKLRVIAQLVASGRAVFCTECRQAFKPALHPGVEVPRVFQMAPAPPAGGPPQARPTGTGGLARQGLARIAEGAGLLLRAAAGGRLHSLARRARRGLARSSGWLTSCVVHAGLLVLAMVLGVGLEPVRPEPEVPITTAMTPEEHKELFEEVKRRDIFSRVHENEQPIEVPVPEVPEAAPPEPLEHIEEEKPNAAPGRPLPVDDVADIPLDLLERPGLRTVMGTGATGRTGAFALRGDRGLRLKAARRGGGGPDTESAVERALAWLARNQNADGSWDLNGKSRKAAGNRWWHARGRGMRPSMTGFAALAFLGAGYSTKAKTKYRDNVNKAVKWLIENQRADGSWPGRTERCTYTQGVATLALAEAWAMSRDPKIRAAARKGVAWSLKGQNPYAGWDYSPRGGTSDTSITVWNCLALRSARLAGLKVDNVAFQGVRTWLNAAQDMKSGAGSGRDWAGGAFAYRGRPSGGLRSRSGSVTVMHPAGLMMRLMTGTRPDRREAYGTANLLLKLIPKKTKKVSAERVTELVEAFIKKHYLRWDSMTAAQREKARADAARAVAAYPRTVDEYIKRHYGARWVGLSEGQRAALRETARQAVASYPQTAEAYIDRSYRPWKTYSEAQRARHRKYVLGQIQRRLYGQPFPRSIYFLYHSSLAMYQMGGKHWQAWNPEMKKTLLQMQEKKGEADGSWAPSQGYGMCACVGRTMSTAMGAMTLEVYYRYLRIYE